MLGRIKVKNRENIKNYPNSEVQLCSFVLTSSMNNVSWYPNALELYSVHIAHAQY